MKTKNVALLLLVVIHISAVAGPREWFSNLWGRVREAPGCASLLFRRANADGPAITPALAARISSEISLKSATSLSSLATPIEGRDLGPAAKQLVSQMQADQFNTPSGSERSYYGNPYTQTSVTFLIKILEQGVQSFERVTRASPEYIWNDGGYDVVGYRVVQSDNTISYILAYRQNVDRNPYAVMLGAGDQRPGINAFFISEGSASPDTVFAAMIMVSDGDLAQRHDGASAGVQRARILADINGILGPKSFKD